MLEIFDKLEKNVCRIFLDDKGNGTGFLISNKFILTDYHVIDENKKIEVKFHNNDEMFKVNLLNIDEKYKELDITVLELEKEIDFYQYIRVNTKKLQRDEQWLTRGYPSKKNDRAEEMRNDRHVIHQHLPKIDIEGFDIELNFDTTKWSSYRGLSGSPIIVDNCIVGIITSQQIEEKAKELYGLSAKYFKELIDEVRKIEQSNNEIIDRITLKNGTSFEIVLVKVKLEDGKTLYVGKCPVTFREYDLFCEGLNIKRPNDYNWGRGQRPVIDVSWYDAIEYCNWLSKKSNYNYRLLTSQEWLSIAKKDIPKKSYKKNIVCSKKKTSKVATRKMGLLGLYDFVGNIYEWCDNNIDTKEKILRGIDYNDSVNSFNELFSNKIMIQLDTRDFRIGFRIAFIED